MTDIDYAGISNAFARPTFGAAERSVVDWFGHRAGIALRAAIRGGALCGLAAPEWTADRGCVLRFAGIESETNCLTARGHDWLWPLERQATEGFAYFLRSGTAAVRQGRALAFLRALDTPRGRLWPERIDAATVVAEQCIQRGPARGCRVDLMIVVREGKTIFGAVVEAKFEHVLSGNPLSGYVAEAARQGLDGRNCSYLVVGLRKDATVRARLTRNSQWRFKSWRRLLIAHERLLAPDLDDDDYRRFRRTIATRVM